MAITLGLTLSSSEEDTKTVTQVMTVVASTAPSISLQPSSYPSIMPSVAPTLSRVPSHSPTTVLDKLDSNQKVAMSGGSMAIVSQDVQPGYLLFYSSTDEGMKRVGAFSLEDFGDEYTISHSGDAFVIEFPTDCDGSKVIYEYYREEWHWVINDRCSGKVAAAADLESDENDSTDPANPTPMSATTSGTMMVKSHCMIVSDLPTALLAVYTCFVLF